MNQQYHSRGNQFKTKICSRFYTHDSQDASTLKKSPTADSLRKNNITSNSKPSIIVSRGSCVKAVATPTTNASSMLRTNLYNSDYSADSNTHFFVTKAPESIHCDQTHKEYTKFRRDMRAAFNIEGLTSSEEENDSESEYMTETDQLSEMQSYCVREDDFIEKEHDSCAPVKKRLRVTSMAAAYECADNKSNLNLRMSKKIECS